MLLPRLTDEGGQPGPAAGIELLQSQGYNGPVLPPEIHHVSHCADGGQIAAGPELTAPLLRGRHGQHQLEGHPHPRQAGEGVVTVGPVGVDHRSRPGQLFLALVVIGNDHIHAQGAGVVGLLHVGDAAVHCDNQGHPPTGQQVNGRPVQGIALGQPVGHIGQHPGPPIHQVGGEQAGGGDAVHIVVAVDADGLAGDNALLQAGRRPIHILELKWVIEEGGIRF